MSLLTISTFSAVASVEFSAGSVAHFVQHGAGRLTFDFGRTAASLPETVIFHNIGLRGGAAPVHRYIPELLDDVLQGR